MAKETRTVETGDAGSGVVGLQRRVSKRVSIALTEAEAWALAQMCETAISYYDGHPTIEAVAHRVREMADRAMSAC